MKRILLALAIPLAFAGPAFAQQTLEQPKVPDDGVGVDYTQPWVNDLLLRSDPWEQGSFIMGRRPFTYSTPECIDEADAQKRAPPNDLAARKAFRDCMEEHRPKFALPAPPPGPGLRPPLLVPQPYDGKAPDLRIPLAPNHPNAQN